MRLPINGVIYKYDLLFQRNHVHLIQIVHGVNLPSTDRTQEKLILHTYKLFLLKKYAGELWDVLINISWSL